MESTKKTARVAGLLYLIIVLTGIFNLLYVPTLLINWDDATSTFIAIKNNEMLFRLGIFAGIVCYSAFLILPLVLYKLLNHIHKPYALAMVFLAVVSVPISFVNLFYKVNVLTLVDSIEVRNGIEIGQLHNQVLLLLKYYNNGIKLVSIFWGLWLLPFGYLVYKSGFLPKLIGILLMVGCFGYLINFTGGFLIKDYARLGIGNLISLPASLGEIGICLWLLIVGIKTKK